MGQSGRLTARQDGRGSARLEAAAGWYPSQRPLCLRAAPVLVNSEETAPVSVSATEYRSGCSRTGLDYCTPVLHVQARPQRAAGPGSRRRCTRRVEGRQLVMARKARSAWSRTSKTDSTRVRYRRRRTRVESVRIERRRVRCIPDTETVY